ncbi:hypothetical protein [Pseudarthrobacter sp. N5]|uniref:hypothetical protein n=1 Tax=Pseudarthrobacter sp. N5 TaxID=3418416 RepID=UPI003CEBC2D9
MKAKLLFGAGIAAGYVLGSRSGRAAYDKLKARATALWQSEPVQDKVASAADAIKEKAPEVTDQLGEAARRAASMISSAMHREASGTIGTSGTSHKTADDVGAPADGSVQIGSAPAHSTHPETVNLGTSDVESDPALNDQSGQDWSGEGGATPAGPATNVDSDRR